MVVALEMMRERAVRETERRLAGDVLAEALGGQLGDEDLRGRLQPFGIDGRTSPSCSTSSRSRPTTRSCSPRRSRFRRSSPSTPPPAARCSARSSSPATATLSSWPARAARRSPESGRKVRAAASRPTQVASLRRAFHEARCALEATAMTNGHAPDVASHRDLGAFTLLLSLQDDDALRTYADNLLGPISDGEGEYGPELLRSLEAFIERNGQWERAARDLYCHRHTLRYRIRRIEELTGRDLGQAQDRIELWLALRARELVR